MAADEKKKKILDCSGFCCSLPLIESRTELDKMETGQILEVVANYPSIEEDMNALTRNEGIELVCKWKEGDRSHFIIMKL